MPAAVTEQGQALVDEIAAVALPLTRLQIDTDHPDKADALKALLDSVTLTWVAAADGAAPAIAIDLTTGAFADTALNEQLFGILKPQISSALQQRL